MKGQKRLSKFSSVFPGLSVKFLSCRQGMTGGGIHPQKFLWLLKILYKTQCRSCKKFHLDLVDFCCKGKHGSKEN